MVGGVLPAAAAAAVVVPLNAWWSAAELEYGLADSGARVLIADAERAERLAGVLPGLGVPCLVARPAGALPDGMESFADVLGDTGDPAAASLPEVAIGPEDEATIFYTSGTTGRPKGALGTHRNIVTNPVSLAYGILSAGVRAGRTLAELTAPAPRVTLLSVPFFHATGCHSVLVTHALRGGTVVLMYKWDVRTALELIERERVTGFGGVPTMAWQVLTSPTSATTTPPASPASATAAPRPRPRCWTRSGAAARAGPRQRLRPHRDVLGHHLQRRRQLPGAARERRPARRGLRRQGRRPGRGRQPAGEVGELLIRGPNVIKGYWNKPEATAAAFEGGWFRSGDLARLDGDGFVYIVDRAKDMLIRGGRTSTAPRWRPPCTSIRRSPTAP